MIIVPENLRFNTDNIILCDVPQGPAHCFIVHVRLVFVLSPELGHCFGVHQFKDALLPVGPLYVPWTGIPVLQ